MSRILHSSERRQTLSVPDENPVKRGTLRALIRQAGLTREQFLSLLR